MSKLRKVLKWLVMALVAVFVGVQFVRPARTNPSFDPAQTIFARLRMTPEVSAILDRSCQDCHSNATRWPWYSNVVPASWFLVDHVNEGREHLNFSEWGKLDKRRADKRLEEMCEQVSDREMPINSYTWIHHSAKLSDADRKTLCDWTEAERKRLATQ
ncbi:MAG TPA: heme-binding domain-containing protein [Pyrinomonadaceae bacterium]|nr:heme-binding domain-containing protein [Pyrinomonadaceae bacterium]